MPFNITIDHETTRHSSDRSSSATDEDSSDTGVHLSPHSEGYQYSEANEEHDDSWTNVIHPDEIRPSDSASRPRTSNRQRPLVEAPQPEDAHRPTFRRRITHERRRNVPQPRSHHSPTSTAPESVDPHEEWQGDARGLQYGRSFTHYPGAYAPQHYSAYSPSNSIMPMVHSGPPPHQPIVPYGFAGYQQPAASPTVPAYIGPSHPMISSGAGSYNMHGGYYSYAPQGFPMPHPINQQPQYVPFPVYAASHPPAVSTSPPPLSVTETTKEDERFSRLEKLLMDQKDEQAAKELAAEKAAAEKVAKAEAEAEKAREIKAAADKAAKEAKEKADKEHQAAADKAAKDAEKAATEAAAAVAAAAAIPSGPPEEKKKPIKFKDAVGRKFQFPFHLCATWSGMEYLIKEAFTHVEVIGPHVEQGHYDLLGPQGEIILPHVWETVIEPDWTITMHMWPMNEDKDAAGAAATDTTADLIIGVEGGPPPPPPAPLAPDGVGGDGKKEKKKKRNTPGLLGWTAGKQKNVKAKKK